MGIFSKKNKSVDTSFSEKQYISGGNLYENEIKKEVQQLIDFQTINRQATNATNAVIEQKLNEQQIQEYYLLQLQVNYFVNTIQFETSDKDIEEKINILKRCAFVNGKAGLLKYESKFIPVGIKTIKYNIFNEIDHLEFVPLNAENVNFGSVDEFNQLTSLVWKDSEKIKNNFVLFKWGTASIPAWLYIWPFIKSQSALLDLINTDKYSYIKKLVRKVNDYSASAEEINEYFDTRKPFITVLKGMDLTNRLEVNEAALKTNPNTTIEFYKQFLGVYYSMFGRRMNNDFKKERSLNKEVDMTNDNYEILEREWKNEFKIFIDKIKKVFNLNVEFVEEINHDIDNNDNREKEQKENEENEKGE